METTFISSETNWVYKNTRYSNGLKISACFDKSTTTHETITTSIRLCNLEKGDDGQMEEYGRPIFIEPEMLQMIMPLLNDKNIHSLIHANPKVVLNPEIEFENMQVDTACEIAHDFYCDNGEGIRVSCEYKNGIMANATLSLSTLDGETRYYHSQFPIDAQELIDILPVLNHINSLIPKNS
jgi:hypothetical protein